MLVDVLTVAEVEWRQEVCLQQTTTLMIAIG